MTDKYYTPEIEEFCVGFECESKVKDGRPSITYHDKSVYEWNKHVITLDDFSNHDLAEEQYNIYEADFRVKHLDREDIESLGWAYKETEHGILSDRPIFSFKNYLLNFDKNESGIWVLITDEYCEYQHFSGKIKKKSELKKLMKQLNIE